MHSITYLSGALAVTLSFVHWPGVTDAKAHDDTTEEETTKGRGDAHDKGPDNEDTGCQPECAFPSDPVSDVPRREPPESRDQVETSHNDLEAGGSGGDSGWRERGLDLRRLEGLESSGSPLPALQ